MINIVDLTRRAAELFPPFIGLVSWKYRVPASSFYHSLSVGALAGGLASLLTNDNDEIELASYTGLVHDYYQKGVSVGLSAEKSGLIIRNVLNSAGVDDKIVRDVEESVRYNVCENPEIWAGKHPEASLSMWLADTVAGAASAFQIEANIALRSSRLSEELRKLLGSLHITIVSITIPQVYLRSILYNKIVEKIRGKCENLVPIIARDGLVIITNDKTCVDNIIVDINDVKLSGTEIDLIRASLKSKTSKFNERFRPELFAASSKLPLPLDERIKNCFIGIELSGVTWMKSSEYKCIFCGLPLSEYVHPSSVGYVLYGKPSMERWNPRVPAVGVNLNTLFQRKYWLKMGVVSCPLCVLDAVAVWREMRQNKISSADYFIQMLFPLPTHYDVALGLSRIAYSILLEKDKLIDTVEESYQSPSNYADHVIKLMSGSGGVPIIDFTWASYLTVVSEKDGETKSLAYYLPYLAMIILYTSVYPVKFVKKPDAIAERRLVTPSYPLYDFEPTSSEWAGDVPLVVALLSLLPVIPPIHTRGVSETDQTLAILDYMKYPREMAKTFLVRHEYGRAILDAYRRFKNDPVRFFT
ncbi:MAG: hypothetical protein QW073_05980 [Desulfurococcaceae archaeon]